MPPTVKPFSGGSSPPGSPPKTPFNLHKTPSVPAAVKTAHFKNSSGKVQTVLSAAKTARKLDPALEEFDPHDKAASSVNAVAIQTLEVYLSDPDDELRSPDEDEFNPDPLHFVPPPVPANPYDPPRLTDAQMDCIWYRFPNMQPFLNLHNVRALFYPLVHPPPMVIDGVEHRYINMSILPDFILSDDRCLCILNLKNTNDSYPFDENAF
jgi:hypothetical protein